MQQGGIQLNLFKERVARINVERYNVWRKTQTPAPPILLNSDAPLTCDKQRMINGECRVQVYWQDSRGVYLVWMPIRFIDPEPMRDLAIVENLVLEAKHRARVTVMDAEESAHARMLAAYLNNPVCIKVSA